MPSKRLPDLFLLKSKGPEYFWDVSGRGKARGAQGQMPSKRWPEAFLSIKSKGPEHFKDVFGRGGGWPRAKCLQKGCLDFFCFYQDQKGQNILGMFPAGGPKKAQGQMPLKRFPEIFA